MFGSSKRRLGVAAVGLSAALALAACSSGDSGDDAASEETAAEETAAEETAAEETTSEETSADEACELPSEVRLISVDSITGPAGFAGVVAENGAQIAVQEINDSGYLGDGVTMTIDVYDDATNPDQGTTEFAKALGEDVPLVFGSVTSGVAVAQAPLAEAEGKPVVFTQAGSPGVVIGDYTFRFTPPMSAYWPDVASYLAEQGVETASVLYANDFPTLIDVAEVSVPQVADEVGIEILSSTGIPTATEDFSAPINKIAQEDPDAVIMLLVGPANPTAMNQLRQAGLTDVVVVGNSGAGNGNLAPAGENGAGMLWPALFHPDQDRPALQEFVEKYQAEFGEIPSTYGPERYDAVYAVADAIKEACSVDPQEVRDALASITEAGYSGVMGDVTFENQDIRVPGILVQWNGEEELLIAE